MGALAAPIAGGVASAVVGKALGGGSRQPTSQQEKIEGVEFQPFTYTGSGGFGVTGSPTGDYGYEFGAELPSWLTDLGAGGAGAAGGLFGQYYDVAQQDPYAAAEEYYQRGMDVLTPQFEQQNIDLQERLFGTGRLGAVIGGVNPEAYQQQKAQQETLAKLYQSSLDAGQRLQTNRLNQLSQAAEAAKNLGMLPMMTEMDLVNFAKNLEIARSNALKQGTQNVQLAETPESVFAGQVASSVGKGVSSLFNTPNAVPQGYTGSWQNPDNYYSSGPSQFGIPNVQNVYSTNAFATGGGNPFWS